MKSVSEHARYFRLRREFGTLEEMGEVLNRSKGYVSARMVGKQSFTYRDKKLLLSYLGETIEKMNTYFPEDEE